MIIKVIMMETDRIIILVEEMEMAIEKIKDFFKEVVHWLHKINIKPRYSPKLSQTNSKYLINTI